MEDFSYRTISGATQGLYKEKGSRFLSFAFPVASEEAIKKHLIALEKEYFDARHHCYAWLLGADRKHFRVYDAGEPNHSAGDPILGQIRSRELTDILVVVVRYFGGTKLGVGGLMTAYKLAAADALEKAVLVKRELKQHFSVTYGYAATPEVMRLIKDFHLEVKEQSFGERCVLHAEVKMKEAQVLFEKLALLMALGFIEEYRSAE